MGKKLIISFDEYLDTVEKLDEMGINFGMDVDKYLKLEV